MSNNSVSNLTPKTFTCELCLCSLENATCASVPLSSDSWFKSFLATISDRFSSQSVSNSESFSVCKSCNRSIQALRQLKIHICETKTKIDEFTKQKELCGVPQGDGLNLRDVFCFFCEDALPKEEIHKRICGICFFPISQADCEVENKVAHLRKIVDLIFPNESLQWISSSSICLQCEYMLEDIDQCRVNCLAVRMVQNKFIAGSKKLIRLEIKTEELDHTESKGILIEDHDIKNTRFSELTLPIPNRDNCEGQHIKAALSDDITDNLPVSEPCKVNTVRNRHKSEVESQKQMNGTPKINQLIINMTKNNCLLPKKGTNCRRDSACGIPIDQSIDVLIFGISENVKQEALSVSKNDDKNTSNTIKGPPDATNRLECYRCGFCTTSRTYILAHLRRSHGSGMKRKDRGTMRCAHCLYATRSRDYLTKHLRRKHGFPHPTELRRPRDTGPWQACPGCSLRTKRKDALRNHARQAHGMKYVRFTANDGTEGLLSCLCCRYKTADAEEMEKHTNDKHLGNLDNEKEYWSKCDHCSYQTKHSSSLKTHYMLMHDTNAQTYTCCHCDWYTKNRYALENHMARKMQRSDQPLRCPVCEYESGYGHEMQGHVRRNHPLQACQRCSFVTLHGPELKAHVREQHPSTEHVCEECGYAAPSAFKKRRHWKIQHARGRCFQCDHCDYSAVRKCSLKEHVQRMHRRGPNLKCSQCDYQTGFKGNLKHHVARKHHSQEFQCLLCPFRTTRKDSLLRHRRSKHKTA